MTIYEQLVEAFSGREGEELTTRQIKQTLNSRYGTNPSSVIPSDFCYNRINNGIPFRRHLFEYLRPGTYKFLGPGRSYTGEVYSRRKGTKGDQLVGRWNKGQYTLGGDR